MTTPIKAIICGYYGYDNGGDEALLWSILRLLPPGVEPVVLSAQPAVTKARYGVTAVDRWQLWPLLQTLHHGHWFIWGGGSLMQDHTSWKNPLYYGGLMAIAQLFGLKTMALAQGIGPFRRSWVQDLTRWLLRGCDAVTVRDQGSSDRLQQWGIDHRLAPDLVWTLAPENPPTKAKKTIGVNLRPHEQLTPALFHRLGQGLQGLAAETQSEILLIPFQESEDLAIAQELQRQYLPQAVIRTASDPRQLQEIFQAVDWFVGMRLHSLIMAIAGNCRCFALSYDPKVSQLMAALSLSGWELTQIPALEDITHSWQHHWQGAAPVDWTMVAQLREEATHHQRAWEGLL